MVIFLGTVFQGYWASGGGKVAMPWHNPAAAKPPQSLARLWGETRIAGIHHIILI